MTAMHPSAPTVTLAELQPLGACAEGLAAFEAAFPEGAAPLDVAVATLPDYVEWYAGSTRRPEVLRTLASNANVDVRKGVAWAPATPPDVLRTLASDAEVRVRAAVARGPATPPDVLQALASDGAVYVRESVAGNSVTPPDVLRTLASDGDSYVRVAARRALEAL
jgi:hypothetical protein